MNFENFFCFLFFFLLLKSDNTIRASSIIQRGLRREYYKLIEISLKRNSAPLTLDFSNYDNLKKYFKADPKACFG